MFVSLGNKLRCFLFLPLMALVWGGFWLATGDLFTAALAGLITTVAWVGVVEWPNGFFAGGRS